MIVLENLVLDDNWIMLDKEEGQDMETAKLVLGNLAKFHAACYAFIQREYGGRGKFMEEWEVVCFENSLRADLKSMNQFFENGINTCVSILKVRTLQNRRRKFYSIF